MSAFFLKNSISRSTRVRLNQSCPRSRSFPSSNLRHTFSSTTTASAGIQLNFDWVKPPEDAGKANHVVLFLHGLLGNGRNLRTMARKLCDRHNQPGMLLDVRGHGGSKLTSQQASTFDACAQDINTTLDHTQEFSSDTKVTLVGHSLGGRISLQYVYNSLHNVNNNNNYNYKIQRVWLLDTVPGEANDSVERVVGAVTDLSAKSAITNRKELVEQLTSQTYGIDTGTAQWLAASLQTNKETGTMEFGFDLTVVNDLLADFHSQDFLGMLNDVVNSGVRVDLVRGGKNAGWTEATLGALRDLEIQSGEHFGFHTLSDAGHWVHVDDLPGLLQIMQV